MSFQSRLTNQCFEIKGAGRCSITRLWVHFRIVGGGVWKWTTWATFFRSRSFGGKIFSGGWHPGANRCQFWAEPLILHSPRRNYAKDMRFLQPILLPFSCISLHDGYRFRVFGNMLGSIFDVWEHTKKKKELNTKELEKKHVPGCIR